MARRLTWPRLLVTVVACLLLPSIVTAVAFRGTNGSDFPDSRSVANLIVSTAVEVALAIAVISWLRWWPRVLHDNVPVRRWMWSLSVILIGAPLILLDYAQLGVAGWALSLGLALGCLLIGTGEELLFRGVVLTFTRSRYREWVAAAVTTALFAAFHLPGGVLVAIGAGLTGALLYMVRRVSGGILLPILAHSLWDFSVYSSHLGPNADPSVRTSQTLFLLSLALVVVVALTHQWWQFQPASASTTQ